MKRYFPSNCKEITASIFKRLMNRIDTERIYIFCQAKYLFEDGFMFLFLFFILTDSIEGLLLVYEEMMKTTLESITNRI